MSRVDVFKQELEDIRYRNIPAGGKSKDGLPPLPQFKDFPSTRDITPKPKNLNEALQEIYGDEQDEIWRKGLKKAAEEKGKAGRPGLVGLALSGGGIRSATFNLGVIQVLKKSGFFDNIHYLSTVSGGGYIGSCLSSVFAHEVLVADKATIEAKNGIKRAEAFEAKAKTAVGSAKVRVEKSSESARDEAERLQQAADAAQQMIGKFPFTHTQGKPESLPFRHLRDYSNYLAPRGPFDLLRVPALMLRGILVNFLVLLPYVILPVLFTVYLKPDLESLDVHLLAGWAVFSWLPGESFLLTKLLFIMFLALLLFYPLWPKIWLLFGRNGGFAASDWAMRDRYGRVIGNSLLIIGLVAFVELQPLAIKQVGEFFKVWAEGWLKFIRENQELLAGIGTVIPVIAGLYAGKVAQKMSGWTGKLAFYVVAILGFLVFWFIYLKLCQWAIFVGDVIYVMPEWLGESQATVLTVYGVALAALVLYSLIFVDVNKTSLHYYYRDRLSKAYLFGWDGENGSDRESDKDHLEHNDRQLLSKLDTEHAPYHLINAALNIHRTKKHNLRGRNADFFIFSKRYVGGEDCPLARSSTP